MLVAERAVIFAFVVLVASNVTDRAKRGRIEVIAVAVEMILGEILVPFDVIFWTEFFGFIPGERFDFEKLNIRGKIRTMNNVVAELVEQEQRICI